MLCKVGLHVSRSIICSSHFLPETRRPGPNSPLMWIRECVLALAPEQDSPLRKKLLVGLNFYGLHSQVGGTGEHVLGNQ